jgi:hypothetical protein
MGATGPQEKKIIKLSPIVKINRDNQENEIKNRHKKTGQKKRNENVKFSKKEKKREI